MAGRLISTSGKSETSRKSPVSNSVSIEDLEVEEPEQAERDPDRLRRSMAIDLLVRGKSRNYVANKLGLSEFEVFRIEEDYYASQARLSEHAMLMKQIERLETVIDALYDRVVGDVWDLDPKIVEQMLKSIDMISELMGLKKQRVEAEVRVIQEQQVPIIISYVDFVEKQMMDRIRPLLTKAGQRQLEKKYDDWFSEATTMGAEIIDVPTAKMTL